MRNKIVIITGSSSGLGKAIAKEMANAGAKVVLNGRNEKKLIDTYNEFLNQNFEVIAVSGDVSNPNDCEKIIQTTLEHYKQIDVLINNAGVSMQGTLEEVNIDVFKKVIDVNYLGSVFMTKAALKLLKETKGSILFVSSVAGLGGIPNFSAYSASKMALTALTESLNIELNDAGVHVGIVYLGFVKNDPNKVIFNSDGQIIPQPNRGVFNAIDSEVVALKIRQIIEKRAFKVVFSPVGKIYNLLHKISPSLLLFIIRRLDKKKKKKKKNVDFCSSSP